MVPADTMIVKMPTPPMARVRGTSNNTPASSWLTAAPVRSHVGTPQSANISWSNGIGNSLMAPSRAKKAPSTIAVHRTSMTNSLS